MIYLDNFATTQVAPSVCDIMDSVTRNTWGNPHSEGHEIGWRANDVVELARGAVARAVGVKPNAVIFTSGATESNNTIIKSFLTGQRRTILLSSIEHPCVVQSAKYMESKGFTLQYIPVNSQGRIDIEAFESMLHEDVALVSVMLVNNEIGTIQDIETIARMTHAIGAVLHSDCAQALGKIPIDMKMLGIDIMSVSAHKCYGPKGIGAIIFLDKKNIVPLLHGGGQERTFRSGTVSPSLCAGFGEACTLIVENIESDRKRIAFMRDFLQKSLQESIPNVDFLGDMHNRVAGALCVYIPDIEQENLFSKLHTLAVSSGSACSAKGKSFSSVLKSIGVIPSRQASVIRICIGRYTTMDDIVQASKIIITAVQ